MPGIGKAQRQNATSFLNSVAKGNFTIWQAGAVKEGTDNVSVPKVGRHEPFKVLNPSPITQS